MANRSIQSIEKDFHVDGNRLSLLHGRSITPGEFAALVASRTKAAHKAFAIYEAGKVGNDFLAKVRNELEPRMSQAAIANLWSVATHIVPLMLRHGFAASPETVKCAIRVLFFPNTETLRPDALEVYRRLQAGTIRQPEMRRLASARKASSTNTKSATELLKEREELKKRLKEVELLIARLSE